MLEAGVPVVYVYISDAHDNHAAPAGSFGPGEAGYVAQLASYNAAFGKFFTRLAADHITKDNTLFIVTADENDHFAGQPGTPAGCDGVNTPATTSDSGQLRRQLRPPVHDHQPGRGRRRPARAGLLTDFPTYAPPAFSVHSDDAPTVYVNFQPGPLADVTRNLERNMASLQAFDPIKGGNVPLMKLIADPAEMALLHMVTQDPARTPTFTYFADDDFYLFRRTSTAGACATLAACSNEQPAFNWNSYHGDFQTVITRTWLGMAGPGVRRLGRNDDVFSDHTDIRPTLLALVGLNDSYRHDGRVLAEDIETNALPQGIRRSREDFVELAQIYKQLYAPLGSLGRNSLVFATRAINSTSNNDQIYKRYLTTIGDITADRDDVAAKMSSALEGAAFGNQPVGGANG